MSRSITLGQYIPGHSFLHRLNPRFKLLSLLAMLTLLFLLRSYLGLCIFLALLLSLLAVSGVPAIYFFRGLRPLLYIVLMTLVVYVFFTPGGVVLFRLGPFTAESAGLAEGMFVVLRLVLLVWSSLLVTLTTTPLALTDALEFFLRPLKLLRLPVSELAMIMTIAMRFIPTLMEESQRVMRAQLARAADFETGNLIRRARSLTPIIVPLFISAFRRADELAIAMEARGYRVGARRTRMNQHPAGAGDWAALLFALALPVIAVITGL